MGLQKRDVSIRQIDAATWDWIAADADARGVRIAEVIEDLVKDARREEKRQSSDFEVA